MAGEGEGAQTSPMASEGRGRVNRVRESEGVGAGWVEGGARLQCGIREWAGTSSSVGTWRRSTNLGLGVVEAGPSRTVRSPKRTVREAGCYSTILYGGHAAEIDPEPCKITSDFYDQNWSYNYPSEVLMNNALGKCSLELTNQKFPPMIDELR